MRCCKGKFNRFKFGNIAIGFGNLRKTNDTGRGLRVRFNGVGSLFGQLAGSLRDFSADFVGSGSFSADLSNIKQLDASIAGQGTLTGDLADFAYLLDDYPNASAAYSVRLLSSTYSGPLVRIRKDTGGQPEKDFYADSNNELSLDSEDGGNTRLGNWIGSNDGYIVKWYEQTENSLGLDLAQSSASAQPQIVSGGSLNVLNSKASLNFDGSNWMNTISLDVADGIAQPWSVTHIGKSNTATPDAFDGIWANQNLEARLLFDNSTPRNLLIQCGFNGFDGQVDTNQHVFNTILDAPNNVAYLYKDNSQQSVTPNTPTNRAFRGLTIAALNSGGALASNYQFQEVILYPNELDDINGINTNINDFYNIYT